MGASSLFYSFIGMPCGAAPEQALISENPPLISENPPLISENPLGWVLYGQMLAS
ncbi:MAG: hypothetical protein LBF22_11505 [Deltaproteobacteria bacterium]|nr:hypothetical protein [Deltaproteobacteria bacterium]